MAADERESSAWMVEPMYKNDRMRRLIVTRAKKTLKGTEATFFKQNLHFSCAHLRRPLLHKSAFSIPKTVTELVL